MTQRKKMIGDLIKMKQQTINYKDLVRRNKQIDQLKKDGVIMIPKKRLKVLGWACVGLGVVTFWIPLTTIPLIAIGLLLLGLSKQTLINKISHRIFMFKYKRGLN